MAKKNWHFSFNSTLHIFTRMVLLGPRRHLHPLPPLLLHLHVLAQAGPRIRKLLLLQTTRRYHRHYRHLHITTRRAQSALRRPVLAPRPTLLLLLLRRMGTRLRLRLTPLLRLPCSHRDLGEQTFMCLPPMVMVVAALAAGEVVVLVVHHLILLLKAHSRNLRHNNIEHPETAGSTPTFSFPVGYLL
jgi:hypothetical protein